ncbi:hypothetical protein D3C79_975630 [compost metagenome]
MYHLADVLCPILTSMTTNVLNDVSLKEGYLISVDELHWLDFHVLVVVATFLLI